MEMNSHSHAHSYSYSYLTHSLIDVVEMRTCVWLGLLGLGLGLVSVSVSESVVVGWSRKSQDQRAEGKREYFSAD